jgi:hypothetical protein
MRHPLGVPRRLRLRANRFGAIASARDAFLHKMRDALDASPAAKKLEQSNRINAEIKSFKDAQPGKPTTQEQPGAMSESNSAPATPDPISATNDPIAVKEAAAQYAGAARLARERYSAATRSAQENHLQNLKRAIDAARVAKNLAEANRIVVIWLSGNSDLWTFDSDCRTVKKVWMGDRVNKGDAVEGRRVD